MTSSRRAKRKRRQHAAKQRKQARAAMLRNSDDPLARMSDLAMLDSLSAVYFREFRDSVQQDIIVLRLRATNARRRFRFLTCLMLAIVAYLLLT